MFYTHVAPQCVYSAIGGGTIRAKTSLRCMGMKMMPSIRNFFTAGFAFPQKNVGG